MKKRFLLPLALVTLAATACAPMAANRGNFLDQDQMKLVVAGIDDRQDVIQKIGSPTTIAPFDDNVWYYLGQKTEKRGIFDPEIKAEKIVEVRFGQDGLVDTVKERREGREEVVLVDRKTPTSGNEYTFMQQMLGNLGKFNSKETGAATTASGGSLPPAGRR